MRSLFVLAAVAWAGGLSFAEAKPSRLAVLPVELVNVEALQQEAVGELLAERISATRAFELLSPARVRQKLGDRPTCARSASCLQHLGRELKHPMLLQLAVAGLGGTHVVRLTLFNARSGARAGSWQEVLSTLDREKLSSTLDRMIAGFAPRPGAERTPWYGRWWVWTVAAGVVAAGTVTAVLLATGNSGPPADVIITPP